MKTTANIKSVEVVVIYDIIDKFRKTIELQSVKVVGSNNDMLGLMRKAGNKIIENSLIKQIKAKL